jgi:magnesium chelatase family protein
MLMMGPLGAGKTLLARALPGILPKMSIDEALDVTRIYSVADQLPRETSLLRNRPFRALPHTISHAGLVGRSNWPHPREISQAHYGVLFLDEQPEFGMRVLEVLRQPMKDKVVSISRAQGSLTSPASFQLVGATNPCPCGYYGDQVKPYTCLSMVVTKYQKRISGPLLDRIDIHVEMPRIEYDKLSEKRLGESSVSVRERVEAAHKRQRDRFDSDGSVLFKCNADMRPADLRKFCVLDEIGQALLRTAMNQLQLSARGYHRVLEHARSISDLAGSEDIILAHLAKALQYRPRLIML